MNISLPELELILKESRDREHRHNKFLAALQGVDLDANQESAEDKFKKAQQRAQAVLEGKSSEEVELDEIEMDYEIEE